MTYFVYMLRCADGSLYTGITNDVARRMTRHTDGRAAGGAKYTASHKPLRLECVWGCTDRSAALRLEYRIKALPKAKKEALAADPSLLAALTPLDPAPYSPQPVVPTDL